MLVEDPVFSGDKDPPIYIAQEYYQFVVLPFSTIKKIKEFLILSSIQRPASSPAVAGLSACNCFLSTKLGSKFTILAYIDG